MKEIYQNQEQDCKIKDLLKKNGVSSTNWRKLKAQASFFLDGESVVFYSTIKSKQTLTIEYQPKNDIIPEFAPLDILYEDDFLLIINKPAGILVHPTTSISTGTLANFITYYLQQQNIDSAFHPVSRLDKDTSGIILVAKTSRIHYLLSKTKVNKTYLALLEGTLPSNEGFINLPIARNLSSIIERKIHINGKPALTYYKLLKNYHNKASLVHLELLTGRTHQIRVHTQALNCPIYGDSLYGKSIDNVRQALHAQSIEFIHPITKKLLKKVTKLPNDIKQYIYKFL